MTEPVRDHQWSCGKCGAVRPNIIYDERDDILKCSCSECGREWRELPLDKVKQLKEIEKKEQ